MGIEQAFQLHPYILTVISTWIFNNIITALISSLPSPTKDSSIKYVYWFKVLNSIMGNISRAAGSHVESSPNFQDAVDKRAANGKEKEKGA